jgi:hypothetical protein
VSFSVSLTAFLFYLVLAVRGAAHCRSGSGVFSLVTSFYGNGATEFFKKRGWSLGWVSAVDSEGRTIWIVDAPRDDGRRFVVHADEKLTAFLELEAAVRACGSLERIHASAPAASRGIQAQQSKSK